MGKYVDGDDHGKTIFNFIEIVKCNCHDEGTVKDGEHIIKYLENMIMMYMRMI